MVGLKCSLNFHFLFGREFFNFTFNRKGKVYLNHEHPNLAG